MKKILLLIIPILLVSCSPTARLARLVKKHPELVKSDTIFKADTTILEAVKTDTAFVNQITKDTIRITKDNLIIKYFNRGDTVFLSGEVKADTIVKLIPVKINSVNPIETKSNTDWWVIIVIIIGMIIILLLIKKILGK